MQIHTFRAKSVEDALRLVRDQLGPDATIVATRPAGRSLFRPWSRQPAVLVTAAVGHSERCGVDPPSFPTPWTALNQSDSPGTDRFATSVRPVELDSDYRNQFRRFATSSDQEPYSLVDQLCCTHPADQPAPLAGPAAVLLDQLRHADVDETQARELIDQLTRQRTCRGSEDIELWQHELAELVAEQLHTSGAAATSSQETCVVAFVGASGVGKTTTIAKLAGHFRLREKCDLGLITLDTQRVAAVDQLATYAQILGVPLHAAATPKQVRQAILQLSDRDLVLIDTFGCSWDDDTQRQALKALLSEAQPDQIHLVISAVSTYRSSRRMLEGLEELGITHLVVSKIDEAPALGHLLPILRDAHLPLSYVTDGRDVPDCLHVAQPKELAARLIGMPV